MSVIETFGTVILEVQHAARDEEQCRVINPSEQNSTIFCLESYHQTEKQKVRLRVFHLKSLGQVR